MHKQWESLHHFTWEERVCLYKAPQGIKMGVILTDYFPG